MKIIDLALLDAAPRAGGGPPRRRMNHNLHERLDDPLNRLLNALEPDTFLPVHRHTCPAKDESIIVLRGHVVSFVFDNEGRIVRQVKAGPGTGVFGFDIPAGEWHGLLAVESGTVVFEAKAGPYVPVPAEDIAPWSPPVDDAEAVQAFLLRLRQKAGVERRGIGKPHEYNNLKHFVDGQKKIFKDIHVGRSGGSGYFRRHSDGLL